MTPTGGTALPAVSQEVSASVTKVSVDFDAVKEGATSVSGRLLSNTVDNPVTNVCVDIINGSDLIQHIEATFDSTKNSFSANLTNPVVEDETCPCPRVSQSHYWKARR